MNWSLRKFRESNMFIHEEWPFADKVILINNHITYANVNAFLKAALF